MRQLLRARTDPGGCGQARSCCLPPMQHHGRVRRSRSRVPPAPPSTRWSATPKLAGRSLIWIFAEQQSVIEQHDCGCHFPARVRARGSGEGRSARRLPRRHRGGADQRAVVPGLSPARHLHPHPEWPGRAAGSVPGIPRRPEGSRRRRRSAGSGGGRADWCWRGRYRGTGTGAGWTVTATSMPR